MWLWPQAALRLTPVWSRKTYCNVRSLRPMARQRSRTESGQSWNSAMYALAATAFHGKWHLGDLEGSYAPNQGGQWSQAHNPPPRCRFAETIFRGGTGDFLEGGVRVPAQAWWPGVIDEGQPVGDIISVNSLNPGPRSVHHQHRILDALAAARLDPL
jgi:hypothetical protein